MSKPILTVSEINSYIKTLMDHDMILNQVLVRGEISNFKLHYSGHMYLTLKDDQSVVRAVMFRGANRTLKFKPEDGMKVIVQGKITVYERGGQYQLYVDHMQPDGIGALHIAFEQLKAKLQKEGLFDETKKKPLPQYPRKIGVVTSATGAAIRDILNVLARRFPYASIAIYPVLVQGEQACHQIVRGISYFNQDRKADVIITGRGGGSIEELWAFNEEAVARCIAASDIPVISAVGHETDFTIADFVADMRAPTPSAAAELAVPSQVELRDKIYNFQSRLIYLMNKDIGDRREHLKRLKQSPLFRNPMDKVNQYRLLLDALHKDLINHTTVQLKMRREMLAGLCGKLDALSPLAVLSRGYAVVKRKANQLIKSVNGVSPGEEIDIRVSDGYIFCKVEGIKNGKDSEF